MRNCRRNHVWRPCYRRPDRLLRAGSEFDGQFPVHESLSAVFCELARTIAEIYPERVNCQIESSYDARFVLFEFNDHPLTTHADVLRVIRAAGGQR